jgi:hypothetical protein
MFVNEKGIAEVPPTLMFQVSTKLSGGIVGNTCIIGSHFFIPNII